MPAGCFWGLRPGRPGSHAVAVVPAVLERSASRKARVAPCTAHPGYDIREAIPCPCW